jgi:hypothetical protein
MRIARGLKATGVADAAITSVTGLTAKEIAAL